MHLERNFTICPYLTGSPEGVMCRAASILIRQIEDISPDICISRHFELCHIYLSKLEEMITVPVFNGNGSALSGF